MNDIVDFDPQTGSSEFEDDRQMSLAYKKHLISFGVFLGILILFFLLNMIFCLLSKKSWQTGMKEPVQQVLSDNGRSNLVLKEFEKLSNPFSVSCVSYLAENNAANKQCHVVLVRITTLFGAVPAVYVWDGQSDKAEFVCFVSMTERVKKMLLASSRNSIIDFWARRVPVIIGAGKEVSQ